MQRNSLKTILLLISSADFLGAERVACELAREISFKADFCVHLGLMSSSPQLLETFKEALTPSGVVLTVFPVEGKFDLKTVKVLTKYLTNNNIQLVHSHGYKSDIYAYIAAKLSDKKIKLFATNHNWILGSFAEKLYRRIDIYLLKRFHYVAAVSEQIRAEMVAVGISHNKVTMLFNGISVPGKSTADRQELRSVLGIAEQDFVIGCVASLTPEKAHKDLIQAFALLSAVEPHCSLLLIGDGPLRQELEQQCADLKLKNVIFAGRRTDVRELYYAMDLFALVSYKEGLPMALLEAMAAGLPVVVTPVGAIPQVITDGKEGGLTPSGKPEILAGVLQQLVKNTDQRREMGQAAYTKVLAHYSSKRMAEDYIALYRHILEGP